MRSSTYMGEASRRFDYSRRIMADDINSLRRILRESHTIAVVGLSADWYRPSYFAAKYMQEHGYRIVPVNPKYREILGEKCYPSLREVPEKIDIVDVFRKTADVMPIAEDAIAISAKVLWQQLGVKNEAAAAKAHAAGLDARARAARRARVAALLLPGRVRDRRAPPVHASGGGHHPAHPPARRRAGGGSAE